VTKTTPASLTIFFTVFLITGCNAKEKPQEENDTGRVTIPITNQIDTPSHVKLLIKYYDSVVGYKDNRIVFADGSSMIYDDSIENKSLFKIYSIKVL